ncbi:hypothetical protein A2U01_0014102, partial [Trifolium medium]|nr:hypothetical protein [Trifolium medium]
LLLQNRNARRSHDSTRQNDDPATIHFSDEFATESTRSDMGKTLTRPRRSSGGVAETEARGREESYLEKMKQRRR